jgi:hypothetical protein
MSQQQRERSYQESEAEYRESVQKKGYQKRETREIEYVARTLDRGYPTDDLAGVQALVKLGEFAIGWQKLLEEYRDQDVPKEKLWWAHVANSPEAAWATFSAKVDPAHHMPEAGHGCLIACKICDNHKPLSARKAEWQESLEEIMAVQAVKELKKGRKHKSRPRARPGQSKGAG